MTVVQKALKTQEEEVSVSTIFNLISNIYIYSVSQNKIDEKFVEWSIKTQLLKKN